MIRDLSEVLQNYLLKNQIFVYSNHSNNSISLLKEFEVKENIFFSNSLRSFDELDFLENDRLNIYFSESIVSADEFKQIIPARFQICIIGEITGKQLRDLKTIGYVIYSTHSLYGYILIISDFINGFPSSYLKRLNSPKLVDLISEPPNLIYEYPR